MQLTFDAHNRITTGCATAAPGNLIGDTTPGYNHTYKFDAENRLIQVNGGASSGGADYTYDVFSRRVRKNNNGAITEYMYNDLSGRAVAELDTAKNWKRQEVFVGATHLATYLASAGETYFVHPDWMGTERHRVRQDGTTAEYCDWYAYGEPIAADCGTYYTYSGYQQVSSYNYAGYERDSETGLDHMWFRYYNPRIGRFMSADLLGGSVGGPQSLNRFSYAGNSPTNYTDSKGLSPDDVTASRNDGILMPVTNRCNLDGFSTSCSLVSALSEAGAVVACPNNACWGVNKDGLPIQFVATETGSAYTCQILGTWSSLNAAGIAAVRCYNDISIATNTEYAGYIVQMANGQFTISTATAGTSNSSSSRISVGCSGCPSLAGLYHTHGAFDSQYDNERFSQAFCKPNSPCDIGTAAFWNVPSFLGTPEGRIELYNLSTSLTFPYGCVLIGSPVPLQVIPNPNSPTGPPIMLPYIPKC